MSLMKEVSRVNLLPEEQWYPAVSDYGIDMPYNVGSSCNVLLRDNPTCNQMQPLLLSNQGRILYDATGYEAKFEKGIISCDKVVQLYDADDYNEQTGTLRTAFKFAVQKLFKGDDIAVDNSLITEPIYNTWMYAPVDVTETKVNAYVQAITESGLEAGTLIIDDKWSKSYGDWRFDEVKFPDPRRMLKSVHDKGFAVMLWLCPYVSFDSEAYKYCVDNDLLLRLNGEIYELTWWNESSACLDLRKSEAVAYLAKQLEQLQSAGVDGFKFDGGDSRYYAAEHEPDVQSYLWAKFASQYKFNELRAEFNGAALSLYERLADKRQSWDNSGLGAILPASLALGLGMHPFFSPDMIGGGEVKDLREGKKFDKEIFIAHCQLAMLLPSVQFSHLPSAVLGEDCAIVRKLLLQRKAYLPYINALAAELRKSKEPLVRLMEYQYPHENFAALKTQFALGERYIVMPWSLREQKTSGLLLHLPEGRWLCRNEIYTGGAAYNFPLKYDEVLIAEKIA